MARARTCPICRRPSPAGGEHAPFCSARCRDVDLGTWLGEGYRISRPMTPGELERAVAFDVGDGDGTSGSGAAGAS